MFNSWKRYISWRYILSDQLPKPGFTFLSFFSWESMKVLNHRPYKVKNQVIYWSLASVIHSFFPSFPPCFIFFIYPLLLFLLFYFLCPSLISLLFTFSLPYFFSLFIFSFTWYLFFLSLLALRSSFLSSLHIPCTTF